MPSKKILPSSKLKTKEKISFGKKIENFLENLQLLSETEKKVIFFIILIVLAIIIGYFWTKNLFKNLSSIYEKKDLSSFKIPLETENTSLFLENLEKNLEAIQQETGLEEKNEEKNEESEENFSQNKGSAKIEQEQ